MKRFLKQHVLPISLIFILILILAACSYPGKSVPEADVQATVDAALAGTGTASAPTPDTQATIDAAVAATDQAQAANAAAIDSAVQATVAAMPTATPVPPPADAYYTTLTEEQLAAEIDQAVNEALAASQQTSTSTTQAAADGNVSESEVQTIQVSISASEQAVANAEALIAAYSDLYGAYASAYMSTLQEIEGDLAAISQSTAEIASVLEQGAEAASAAAEQLNAAAETAQTKAAEALEQAQASQGDLQQDIQKRLEELKNLQPNDVASDRLGAVKQTFDFVDGLKGALGGGKITPEQLKSLSQQGVNASASLRAQGGPQLQEFSGGIDRLNQQMARGEWPQARSDVGGFEAGFQKQAKRPGRK